MSFLLSCALALLSPDVVVLEDGRRLAGELGSPASEGSLRLLTARGPRDLPRAAVQEVLDREALLPSYARLRDVGEGGHAALSRALWCLDRGLYPEALDELDEALRREAENPIARRLLQRATREAVLDGRTAASISDRAAVMEQLTIARGRSPARAAVARHWLVHAPGNEARHALEHAADSGRIEVRRECLRALISRAEPASLATLILRSLEEKDEPLRKSASQAVLASGHPDLVVPYARALRHSRAHVRNNALPVLEQLQDPRALGPLISALRPRQSSGGAGVPRNHIFVGRQISLVQDFDVEIAQGAVIADPVIGVVQEGALLDVRATSSPAVARVSGRAGLLRALERISGRRFGDDPAAWRDWWTREGKALADRYVQERRAERQGPPAGAAD